MARLLPIEEAQGYSQTPIEPFPFQEEDIRFFLGKSYGLNANEMGLGKTVEALEELRRWRTSVPWANGFQCLIVCPSSVKSVWVEHIERMFPSDVPIYLWPHDNGGEKFSWGFFIINWEALYVHERRRKRELTEPRPVGRPPLHINPVIKDIEWDYIIADEVHRAKNRKAKQTRALKRLKADHRRGLSGTPLVNRPDELWSILNWLDKQTFSSYWNFFEAYCAYTFDRAGYRRIIGPKNIRLLREVLRPFTIRRLKKDVLTDLPEKYYTYLKLPMTEKQARAYAEMKRTMVAWIDQLPEAQMLAAPVVIAQLTRLRQFADAYSEVQEDGSVRMVEPSNKLDALLELLQDTEGPVVIFTQFKKMAKLASARLQAHKISHLMLTGDEKEEIRPGIISDFQAGVARALICTTQTGGIGITLHRASRAIFLDRTWSPATNSQAEDRLHRMGQKNAVEIVIMQSVGTVDFVIEERLELKRSWIKAILS